MFNLAKCRNSFLSLKTISITFGEFLHLFFGCGFCKSWFATTVRFFLLLLIIWWISFLCARLPQKGKYHQDVLFLFSGYKQNNSLDNQNKLFEEKAKRKESTASLNYFGRPTTNLFFLTAWFKDTQSDGKHNAFGNAFT